MQSLKVILWLALLASLVPSSQSAFRFRAAFARKVVASISSFTLAFSTISPALSQGSINDAITISSPESQITTTTNQISLAEQVKLLQLQQAQAQRQVTEDAENQALIRQLTYPEGKLIARGIISLSAEGSGADPRTFPSGLLKANDLTPVFGEDGATIFILAVGREGPPLAAKRIPLKDITFPLVFEITTDNLLFPYTPEAYKTSDNSKDSIAVTCILSPTPILSEPTSSSLVGFGISEPVTIAGVLSRSSAKLTVNKLTGKVNTELYTESERTLLAAVDEGMRRNEEVAARAASTATSTTASSTTTTTNSAATGNKATGSKNVNNVVSSRRK